MKHLREWIEALTLPVLLLAFSTYAIWSLYLRDGMQATESTIRNSVSSFSPACSARSWSL